MVKIIYFKLLASVNKEEDCSIFFKFKLDNSTTFNEVHWAQSSFISFIKELLKFDIFIDCKETHPLNKELIFVIEDVSKLEKSIFSMFSAFSS